jgi:hypothetical protein
MFKKMNVFFGMVGNDCINIYLDTIINNKKHNEEN